MPAALSSAMTRMPWIWTERLGRGMFSAARRRPTRRPRRRVATRFAFFVI